MKSSTSILFAACALALASPALVAQQSLTTTMVGGTFVGSGAQNTAYFDITAKVAISITAFDLNSNTAVGTAGTIDVWITTAGTSYAGNELTVGAWTQILTGEPVTAAGSGLPSSCSLTTPINLTPGKYGIAIVYSSIVPLYSNLNGVQTYTDPYIQIDAGSISADPFVATLYSPRTWNGTVHYGFGPGLHANFSASPTQGVAPLSVAFTDYSKSTAPGGVAAWAWDFDSDGTVDSAIQNPTNTYQGGIWTVTLDVSDGVNAPSTRIESKYIEVGQLAASFSYLNTPTGNTSSVQFTDTSTGIPLTWEWDFDNNGVIDSTQQNPLHVYQEPGIFVVRLKVTNALSSSFTEEILTFKTLVQPAFVRTYTHATRTRGYWFVTPVAFSITSVLVPDDTGHGQQAVAILKTAAQSGSVSSYDVLYESGIQPSNQVQPCIASFEAGDTVVVFGACGDTSIMHNSYGAGGPSTLLGQPVTLQRILYQSNLVSTPPSGAGLSFSMTTGSIGRVETGVSDAVGIDFGLGTDAGNGAGAPELTTTGLPILGKSAELTIASNDPGMLSTTLIVGLGRGPISTPFGAINLSAIYLDAAVPTAAGAGSFKFNVAVPNSPALMGGGMSLQAITIVPGTSNTFGMSNGVAWTIGAY